MPGAERRSAGARGKARVARRGVSAFSPASKGSGPRTRGAEQAEAALPFAGRELTLSRAEAQRLGMHAKAQGGLDLRVRPRRRGPSAHGRITAHATTQPGRLLVAPLYVRTAELQTLTVY